MVWPSLLLLPGLGLQKVRRLSPVPGLNVDRLGTLSASSLGDNPYQMGSVLIINVAAYPMDSALLLTSLPSTVCRSFQCPSKVLGRVPYLPWRLPDSYRLPGRYCPGWTEPRRYPRIPFPDARTRGGRQGIASIHARRLTRGWQPLSRPLLAATVSRGRARVSAAQGQSRGGGATAVQTI